MRIERYSGVVFALALSCIPAASVAQASLATSLEQGWQGLPSIRGFDPQYCKESFDVHLPNAEQVASRLRSNSAIRSGKGAVTTQVWAVSESWGGSFFGVLAASPTRAEFFTVLDDEPPEHGAVDHLNAKSLEALVNSLMSLPIQKVNDVADGSCTLVIHGLRARMFPPGYDVRATDGGSLEKLLQVFENP